MTLHLRRTLAATFCALMLVIVLPSAALALGELAQKPGTAGCISETGTGGACADGVALDDIQGVAVSPDGRSAYAASPVSDAVAVFDRATDGSLTQKPGVAGCISETGSGGACADGVALDNAISVVVSPDGGSVYVTSAQSDSVAVFDRAASGALTQKAGLAGCISETGTGGLCTDGVALDFPRAVTVSPDNASVYVASLLSDAVVVFDRAAGGALTQKAGLAGCISETGTGGLCTDGVALDEVRSVAVSPDGTSVYATAITSDSVVLLNRSAGGALTQPAGATGCISETGTAGACTDGVALDGPQGVAVSPDGASVYVAASNSNALVVFDRAANGVLTQKVGTAGCISETGTSGACADGVALVTAFDLVVSPDGASVYLAVYTSDAVAVFDRAANGTLSQKAGTAGCISDTGTSGACVDGVALDLTIAVAVSPDGTSVYSASTLSDAVVVFNRVPPAADLGVTVTDSPDPVLVDDDITYTISVTNNGPEAATSVRTTNVLPAGTTFKTAGTSVTCLNAAGTVTCDFAGVAVGATEMATLVAAATTPGAKATTVTVDGTEFDPVSGNDSAVATTTVDPAAELALTLTDGPDPVVLGGAISYTVSVTNDGPNAATGVLATDVLPPGLVFSSAASSSTCSEAGGTVTCDFGGVVNGATETATIVATATQAGAISNTVTVDGVEADRVAANDSATSTTQVTKRSTATTLTLSSTSASEGSSVTFTASVSGGSSPTGTVTFRDGATSFATVALGANGTASTSTSTLAVGDHSISASYAGDGGHLASTSASVTFTVQARASDPAPNPAVPTPVDPFTLTNLTVFGSCISKPIHDIAVRYSLSDDARVTYTLQRRTSPRLRTPIRTCPKPVTGMVARPTFTNIATRVRSLGEGSNSIRLSQFVRVANLSAGVYRLQIRAVRADGAPSRTVNIVFIVTAR